MSCEMSWKLRLSRSRRTSTTSHSSFRPISDFNTHFEWQKLSKYPLYYHRTLRGQDFTLTICTVSKPTPNQSSLMALSVSINNSEWPTWHSVPFRHRGSRFACWLLLLGLGVTYDENKFDKKWLHRTEGRPLSSSTCRGCRSSIRKLAIINLNTIFQIMTQTAAEFQQLGFVLACVHLAPSYELKVFVVCVSTRKHKKRKRAHSPYAELLQWKTTQIVFCLLFSDEDGLRMNGSIEGSRQEACWLVQHACIDGQLWILWIQITGTCPLFREHTSRPKRASYRPVQLTRTSCVAGRLELISRSSSLRSSSLSSSSSSSSL